MEGFLLADKEICLDSLTVVCFNQCRPLLPDILMEVGVVLIDFEEI